VKQAAPTREAGFTAPVKQASPEPLTESLIKPQHARSARGDQEVINQEKGSKVAVEQESGGQENRESIPKSKEAIAQEAGQWFKEHSVERIEREVTWETAEPIIMESFAQLHRIAPDVQVRKPRDIRRLDDWENNGWCPRHCVVRVQCDLVRGLEKGNPVRSLNFSEPGLAEFFAALEDARRKRAGART
jgi:hypothetical protein